jgi:phosphoribosylformylglycinamidine cyclo-ligase
LSGATWGGGETPTLRGVIPENEIDLAGSAVGIIWNPNNLITDKGLVEGDRIILLKSNGVNANGLSLVRAVAKKLTKGFATKITSQNKFGELVLTETNIYAKLIGKLQKEGVGLHYISNITGHGLRKIMRARPKFSYILDQVFEPQEVFKFIQKEAKLSDLEMYRTFNMGQDFAIFVPEKDADRTLKIIAKQGHLAIDAGVVEKGQKQVVITPKNITFNENSMNLR